MRTLIATKLSLLLLLLSGPALESQELPPADELIERYVTAIGGESAFLSISSVRMEGTVEMRAMGVRGEFEIVQAAPNRTRMVMSLPQIGEVASGYDGEVGWSDNPLTGPMLLDGDELEQTAERSDARAQVRHRELVPERETVGQEEHAGESCWRVRLVWASGRESFDCYSQETGLLIASEERQTTALGEVPVVTMYADYEEVDGVRLPTRMVQHTMGQEQVISIHEIRVGEVDPSELVPPARIQALLD